MEAAGIAVGIAGLYTTCRDCYNFFTTVKKAKAESANHLRELEIQRSILKAWGFHWQIHDEGGRGPKSLDRKTPDRTKLQAYLLSNRFKAEGVFSTLSAIADTLSNQKKLIKRYGIQLQPAETSLDPSHPADNVSLVIHNAKVEDVEPVISEVKKQLSVLNKCKWVMKDRDNFRQLINDLRSHSESLYRLCPENAFQSMNIYLTMDCLARQESPGSLKSMSRLAVEQAADNGTSSMRAGYQLLASAATLKASVNENRDGEQADINTLGTVSETKRTMRYLGKGLALFEGQVVYVERRDYRGKPLEFTAEQEKRNKRREPHERSPAHIEESGWRRSSRVGFNSSYSGGDETDEDDESIEVIRPADPRLRALIVNFFKTFEGASMRDSVFGLDIAGMIDHTEGEYKDHCSILYRLPDTIGIHDRERPAENLKLRAPITLSSLFAMRERKGVRSMLGVRLELARKLVSAVCLLHSSGWLHKNIRAESVLFFPERASALHEDRYDTDVEIDVSNPVLMGYIFSRPDDVNHTYAPSLQQLEDLNEAFTNRSTVAVTYSLEYRTRQRNHAKAHRRPEMHQPSSEWVEVTNISGFKLDYYQHPAKHADPQRVYRHAYDIYSLGILLLEVGLWKQLRDYEDSAVEYDEDHYERRRWVCRKVSLP